MQNDNEYFMYKMIKEREKIKNDKIFKYLEQFNKYDILKNGDIFHNYLDKEDAIILCNWYQRLYPNDYFLITKYKPQKKQQ
jgi:hypothetical protein